MTTYYAAIVDGYFSGARLAPEFKKRGYTCVMIQSSPEPPAEFGYFFRPDDYAAVLTHESLEETCRQLTRWNPRCVVAGSELGVELADQLSEKLGLPSNGTSQSAARRDKFEMGEALRRRTIPSADQFRSSDVEAILAWCGHRKWPLVVKPLKSWASDGVALCHSPHEVRSACERILLQKNEMGLTNRDVLVQRFLRGTEFVVDTVSWEGRHKAVAFWRYSKPSSPRYVMKHHTMELLPYEGRMQELLFAYVKGVLDALGIVYGPTHCEVIWERDSPFLVEMGARLNGGATNSLAVRACSGSDQIEWMVTAYTDPDSFLKQVDQPYRLKKHGLVVFLYCEKAGILTGTPGLDRIRALDSFHHVEIVTRPGESVPLVPGWLVLAHEDRKLLERDRKTVFALEKHGLFALDRETERP